MADRVNIDAPDNYTDADLIRRFALAHEAGSIAVAQHPSGEVTQSTEPSAFSFDDLSEIETSNG